MDKCIYGIEGKYPMQVRGPKRWSGKFVSDFFTKIFCLYNFSKFVFTIAARFMLMGATSFDSVRLRIIREQRERF